MLRVGENDYVLNTYLVLISRWLSVHYLFHKNYNFHVHSVLPIINKPTLDFNTRVQVRMKSESTFRIDRVYL
jgi:hypothetical protein